MLKLRRWWSLGISRRDARRDKVLEEFQNRLKIKSGETTLDGKFSIDALRCVGACGIAPVVLVGEKVYKKVEPKDVAKIISEY